MKLKHTQLLSKYISYLIYSNTIQCKDTVFGRIGKIEQ